MQMTSKQELKLFIEEMLVMHTAFDETKKSLESFYQAASTLRDSIGVFVVGESRTGKSRLQEELTAKFKSSRNSDGTTILPILRVQVPSKPTVKGLTSEMLAEYGDPAANKGTEQDKTRRLLHFINACQTRMIIIDEIQHFVDKTSKYRIIHHLTDWLKTLLNKSNIVVVIAGLPYAEALLYQNEQLRGRFVKTMRLPRFDWNDEDSRAEFIGLLEGFKSLLSEKFTLPDIEADEFAYRFYLATGGLTGYVFNIIRQAAWIVIDEDRTVIRYEDIENAYLNVVNQIDQYQVSPFSDKFKLNETVQLKKAANIGKRTDEYQSETIQQAYKPRTLHEALI